MTTLPTGDTSPSQRRAVLVVVAVALLMVVSAVSGLNVALPALARDTGASQTQLTWVVDAYTVVFAGLLLGAGALGDRYGRKRLLISGLVVFGGAAAWATQLFDPSLLVVARALMGAGAAAVMPTTLSVITSSFPKEERGHAVGVWVGVAGGGAVLGLFGSGLLLEYFAWNSFFWLNVALAVLALAGTLAVVPSSRETGTVLDWPGTLLSLVGVAATVYAIIEGTDQGWGQPLTLAAAALAVAGSAAFVTRELRTTHPLLDVRLFAQRGFGIGSLSVMVQFFASFGFFFIVLQYLQFVVGRSPLLAATTLLPLPLVLIPAARIAPRLAQRLGTNLVSGVGLLCMAGGLAVLSRLTVSFSATTFYVGLVPFALGMGLAGTPATTAITASLPPSQQGVASAVNDVSRELGSALGIAVLGSLLASSYRAAVAPALVGLPPQVAEGALSSIAFVQAGVLDRLGAAGPPLVAAAREAFVEGVSTAVLWAAVAVAAGAAIVVLRAPRAGDR